MASVRDRCHAWALAPLAPSKSSRTSHERCGGSYRHYEPLRRLRARPGSRFGLSTLMVECCRPKCGGRTLGSGAAVVASFRSRMRRRARETRP
jgi:hypothetical protein